MATKTCRFEGCKETVVVRGNRRYCPEHAKLVDLMVDREARRRYREAHPDRVRAEHNRRVDFKGRRLAVPVDPRTGTCSICGRDRAAGERQFHMHHYSRYDESDPLSKTVELCPKCHRYQTCRRARVLKKLLGLDGRTLGAVIIPDNVTVEELASAGP